VIASRSLHERLKAETEHLHRAAELALDVEGRLSTLDGYVELVERLWSLHAGLERALQPHGPDLFGLDLGDRLRSPLLLADLQSLAGTKPRLPPVVVGYATPAAAMGGLYVLEGSSLGGRVLFHRARQNLGITEHRGGRFLAGRGRSTAIRWRGFLKALASLPGEGDAADQAQGAATATFRIFIERLRPGAP
jgi:heme oxygenase